MLNIRIIPALKDNYIFFLEDPESEKTAIIDPGEAKPVMDFLEKNGKGLDYILNTHHHWDHTNGNQKLKKKYGAQIVAYRGDGDRISGIDIEVEEGIDFMLGAARAEIYEVPGHTKGHIAFHFPASTALFCGDTLFSLGCGRMFEGTAQQMWHSLKKLTMLPDNTLIYCGHEYTENNGEFCLTIEPDNAFLLRRMEGVRRLRQRGQPTIPAILNVERNTNVFLRADHPDLKAALDMQEAEPHEVFAYLRAQKDNFG